MPKRKLLKPSEETLDLIKEALGRGRPLTEEEAATVDGAYRLQVPKELPFGVTIGRFGKGKNGEFRVWMPDSPTGPGMQDLPLTRKLQELERDALTQAAKLRRRAPTDAAAKAKRGRSKAPKIEQALRAFGIDRRDAVKNVAQQLHVSEAYVRSVRSKVRRSEGTI